jgi:uncharacterized protein
MKNLNKYPVFKQVKEDPIVLHWLNESYSVIKKMGFTEHGFDHAEFVSERAHYIASNIGLSKHDQDLAITSSFCHDIGNFLSRTYHHYLGSILFFNIFQNKIDIGDLTVLMQAISNHDKEEMKFMHPASAITIIADKSDVRRNRVLEGNLKKIKKSIHYRVNYATVENNLFVDRQRKLIRLELKIDKNFCEIMEYFEIFTDRMNYCRLAAKYLDYRFNLVINDLRLL